MIWIVVAGFVALLAFGLLTSIGLGGYIQLGLAVVVLVIVLLTSLVRLIRRNVST